MDYLAECRNGVVRITNEGQDNGNYYNGNFDIQYVEFYKEFI